MRSILSIFTVIWVTSVILANPIPLDLDPDLTSHDSEWLRYNDGTAEWFDWKGTCKAVWFDIQDFIPTADSGYIEQTEVWFYHHATYPWDTSNVYIEIWTGDETGPVTQLDKTMATALHNMPTYAYYDPPLKVRPQFCLMKTRLLITVSSRVPILYGNRMQPANSLSPPAGKNLSFQQCKLGSAESSVLR